jgi:hypothetical protein
LRHAFAAGALQAGVPLNVVQRWFGHARMSTTSIYADVPGLEERELAVRFWRASRSDGRWRRWIVRLRYGWSRTWRTMLAPAPR